MIKKKYIKSNKLNIGNTNLGYEIEEQIKEYIDNEFDADGKDISINIFEGKYKMYSEGNNEDLDSANRYGFAIIGNGKSFDEKELNDIFNIGISKSYENKALKNAKFGWGIMSGLCGGKTIRVITKRENEQSWSAKEIHYNEIEESTYETLIYEMKNNEVKTKLEIHNIERDIEYGTIIIVEGIEKRKIGEEELFFNKLEEDLNITYFEELKNKKIAIINTHKEHRYLKGIDPLGRNLPKDIRSTCFAYYELNIEMVLDKLDNIAKNKILSHYKDKDLSNEKIMISLYKLNINKNNKSEVAKKYPSLSKVHYPSMTYTGMYLMRLKRLIGQAIKVEWFGGKTHNKNNLFRGEIKFSTIFDDLFGIQINKNRNALDEVIRELVEECIMNDQNLVGKSVINRINKATGFEEEEQKELPKKRELSYEEKINKVKEKLLRIEADLMKYKQKTDGIDKVRKMIDKDDINKIDEEIAKIQAKYNQNYKRKYKDTEILIKRIKELRKRKKLSAIERYAEFNNIKEARIEAEVYGYFKELYKTNPELFQFKPQIYHTQEGIDYLVELEDELYNELEFVRRFGELEEKICSELQIKKNNYVYVEFKYVLEKKMNHSLELVSHIICWKKRRGIQKIFTETGDEYVFCDGKNAIINESGNKVKIIYLRDLLKQVTRGKWISE